jgi:hypothetical protein
MLIVTNVDKNNVYSVLDTDDFVLEDIDKKDLPKSDKVNIIGVRQGFKCSSKKELNNYKKLCQNSIYVNFHFSVDFTRNTDFTNSIKEYLDKDILWLCMIDLYEHNEFGMPRRSILGYGVTNNLLKYTYLEYRGYIYVTDGVDSVSCYYLALDNYFRRLHASRS